MRHGGHSGNTEDPCASCRLQNGRLSELGEHRSEKSVGNREIASNRVQKKYHRSLTPFAWLEASGGTALSMDPMAEKYGFKQSGISISSEPLCNLPVRHRRGLGRMAYDEATESTKTKFRSGME